MNPAIPVILLFLFLAISLALGVKQIARLAVKRQSEPSEEEQRRAFDSRINGRRHR
jgi:hypothetical protein